MCGVLTREAQSGKVSVVKSTKATKQAKSNTEKRPTLWSIPVDLRRALNALAAEKGVSPSELVTRILSDALGGGRA